MCLFLPRKMAMTFMLRDADYYLAVKLPTPTRLGNRCFLVHLGKDAQPLFVNFVVFRREVELHSFYSTILIPSPQISNIQDYCVLNIRFTVFSFPHVFIINS